MSSEHVPAEPAEPREPAGPDSSNRREVRLRRAPKFGPFMGAGIVLGIIVAAISAYTGPENAEFTRSSIFGFLAVLFGIAGMLLGALVVLILDRISIKRSEKMLAVETPEQTDPEQDER